MSPEELEEPANNMAESVKRMVEGNECEAGGTKMEGTNEAEDVAEVVGKLGGEFSNHSRAPARGSWATATIKATKQQNQQQE